MKWNLEHIVFLHPPDIFAGSFDNAKMQARYERQVQEKLEQLLAALDREDDPLAAMTRLHHNDRLQFLQNNRQIFQQVGTFESALLQLYSRLNAPFASGGDHHLWHRLFDSCDPGNLLRLGSTIPFASATVYRGSVSGFQRSLSWTPDRPRAVQFFRRWQDPGLGGGQLYQLDVKRDDILVYRKHRHEAEVIVSPGFISLASIRPFEPAETG